jgi:hypothetical protein
LDSLLHTLTAIHQKLASEQPLNTTSVEHVDIRFAQTLIKNLQKKCLSTELNEASYQDACCAQEDRVTELFAKRKSSSEYSFEKQESRRPTSTKKASELLLVSIQITPTNEAPCLGKAQKDKEGRDSYLDLHKRNTLKG